MTMLLGLTAQAWAGPDKPVLTITGEISENEASDAARVGRSMLEGMEW